MKKQQLSEIKISYQNQVPNDQRIKITSSRDAYWAFMNTWDGSIIEFQEEAKMLLLNRANEVLGVFDLSKGGISGTVIDTRIVFSVALKCMACSVILAHNHPSSNLQPSLSDIDLTKKLVEAGKFLDILVLDHLIITKSGYSSMADEGII